jgi:cell division protein ZapA
VKRPVEVSIMGQKFMVRSESNEDYILEISKFVDEKVNEVIQTTKAVASTNVALLAAMNIADEYMKYKQGRRQSTEKVEKKIKDMIELIDLHL